MTKDQKIIKEAHDFLGNMHINDDSCQFNGGEGCMACFCQDILGEGLVSPDSSNESAGDVDSGVEAGVKNLAVWFHLNVYECHKILKELEFCMEVGGRDTEAVKRLYEKISTQFNDKPVIVTGLI